MTKHRDPDAPYRLTIFHAAYGPYLRRHGVATPFATLMAARAVGEARICVGFEVTDARSRVVATKGETRTRST